MSLPAACFCASPLLAAVGGRLRGTSCYTEFEQGQPQKSILRAPAASYYAAPSDSDTGRAGPCPEVKDILARPGPLGVVDVEWELGCRVIIALAAILVDADVLCHACL